MGLYDDILTGNPAAPQAGAYDDIIKGSSTVLQETAKAVPRVVGGIAQEAGEAAQYLTGDRIDLGLRRWGERVQAENAMTPGFVAEHPVIAEAGQAAEGVAKMAPYVVGQAAVNLSPAGRGLKFAAHAVLPAVLGASQGQRSYESGLENGLPPEEALAASQLPAAVTTAGMAAMGPAVGGVRKLLPKAMDAATARAAGKSLMSSVLPDLAAGTAAGTAVMQAQGAATAAAERLSGARPDADPWKEVIANPKAWLQAALTGGMFEALSVPGKLAHGEALKAALNDPQTPRQVKAQAVIAAEAEVRKEDPVRADALRENELRKVNAGEALDADAIAAALLPKEEKPPTPESAQAELTSAIAESLGLEDKGPLEVLADREAEKTAAKVEETLAPHAEAAVEAAKSKEERLAERIIKTGSLQLRRGAELDFGVEMALADRGYKLVDKGIETSGSIVRRNYGIEEIPLEARDGETTGAAGQEAEGAVAPQEGAAGEKEITLVHGSGNPNLTVADIDIMKGGKQGKKYGGFYASRPEDVAHAEGYARMMGGEPTLYDVKLKEGAKVYDKEGDITRLSKKTIDDLREQGYAVVRGKDVRGRTEYAVIDKDGIKSLERRTAAETEGVSYDAEETRRPEEAAAAGRQGADENTVAGQVDARREEDAGDGRKDAEEVGWKDVAPGRQMFQLSDTEALARQGDKTILVLTDPSGKLSKVAEAEKNDRGEWVVDAAGAESPEAAASMISALRRADLGVGTKFNRDAATGVVSPDEVRTHLESILKNIKTPVEIVGSAKDIPGLKTDVAFSGAFHDGKIFLNAEHLSSVKEAERVLLEHEIAHSGLRGLLGRDFDSVLAKAWADQADAVRKFAAEKGIDLATKSGKLEAVEEYIVSLAEHGQKNTVWEKFVAVLKAGLRKAGFDLKFSDAELRSLVLRARASEMLTSGEGTRFAAAWHGSPHDFPPERRIINKDGKVVWRSTDSNEVLPELREGERVEVAEHGAFDKRKIGTGEGAQAYGHGLYFAGSKKVAEWYKEKLSQDEGPTHVTVDGEDIPYHEANNAMHRIANMGYEDALRTKEADLRAERAELPRTEQSIREYEEALERIEGSTFDSRDREAMSKTLNHLLQIQRNVLESNKHNIPILERQVADIKALEGKTVKYKFSGRLYQVELAPKEEEYLDWDKPLSEQSEVVKEALRGSGFFDESKNPRGADMYHLLSTRASMAGLPGSEWRLTGDPAASEYLHSLGIRGIKYLDGSSRNVASTQTARIKKMESDIAALKANIAEPPAHWKGQDNLVPEAKERLAELEAALEKVKRDENLNSNYVIFNDADVEIKAKFNRVAAPKEAKEVVSSVSDVAFKTGAVLKHLGDRVFRFVFPEDRIIKAAIGTFRFNPIHTELRNLSEYKQRMAGAATDILHAVHTNATGYKKLFATEELQDKAAKLAFLESVYQLDGSAPQEGQWVPETMEVVDNTPGAPPETKTIEKGAWKAPNVEDFAMAQTLEEAYREVQEAMAALDPPQLKAVRELQNHIREADRLRLDALKEKNNFLFGADSEEARSANASIDEVARLAGRYMPLTRFGDHLVRVYDGEKHVRTESFESRSGATDYVAQMRAKGKQAILEVREPHDGHSATIPASFLDKVQRAAEANGLTGKDLESFVAEYKRQWASTLPDSSLRANEVRRSNMAGFDTNLLRVYEHHMQKFANAVPKIRYGVKIEQTFRDMRNNIKGVAESEASDPRLTQEMYELHNALYERQHVGATERINPLVRLLNKGVFLNYLASPSVWLVQWSQPFMITLPKLSARHGAVSSTTEFNRAAKEYLWGKYSDEKIQEFDTAKGGIGEQVLNLMDELKLEPRAKEQKVLRDQINGIFGGLTPEEQSLLVSKMMILRGGNDLAFSHDVMDDIAGANKLDRGVNKAVELGGTFMRASETGSRRAANLAAFRLDFAKHRDFAKASDYAMEIIDDTLYNFDSENRAGWMRGNAGRLLGMFQYFRLHTVAKEMQLVRDAIGRQHDQAIKAANGDAKKIEAAKAAKTEARKELAFQMAATMTFAGAAGTPLAMMASNTVTDTLWAALQHLFGDPDDPLTLSQMAEAKTKEMFGDEAGNVLSRGIFSLANIDVSRRIGMGGMANLVPGDPPPGLSGSRRSEWYAARVLGPSWGMLTDQMRAMEAYSNGDMGAAMKYSSPKILKDLMKAYDINAEGVQSATGRTIMPPEMVTPWAVALQMVGINPMDVSLAREEAREVSNLSTVLTKRRSGLIGAFEKAQSASDFEAREEALKDISAWGQKNPKLAISQKELATAVRRAMDKRAGKETKKEMLAKEMIEKAGE